VKKKVIYVVCYVECEQREKRKRDLPSFEAPLLTSVAFGAVDGAGIAARGNS